MKYFTSLVRQFFFWMLFFLVQRGLFLIIYSGMIRGEEISFRETLLTFIYALRLDSATSSYFLIIPFFILLLQLFIQRSFLNLINKIYTAILLVISLLVSIGEIGLFGEWNTKLNFKAIVYLKNPSEVFNSVQTVDLLIYFGLIILLFFGFLFLYNRYFYKEPDSASPTWQKIIFSLFTPLLLFVGVRGGVSEIPITTSSSYFSKHNILNLAAVNPVYNIVFSTIEYFSLESVTHFQFMPKNEAEKIVNQIYFTEKDTTVSILNQEKPNIIMIFLESWSGDLIESLGGQPGITPRFHELEKEGMLFTQFYATGNRSQQALASVFGGLPALPVTTLTDYPEKYASVPSLIKDLNSIGYFTSFYFGGDLNYGNIKSYLIYNEFNKLIGEEDFDPLLVKGKLGYHDEVLFTKMLDELGQQEQPFFTAALTLSSHSPYDQPGDRPIDWIETENEYVNSAHYTDNCLGDFFKEVRGKPWYEHTLFIILADHSHLSYNNYQWWSFNYRRIPLLLTGGALSDEFQNSVNERICTNADLTSTLLKQLHLNDTEFKWSKNLFNPYTPEFANFELNDGFGWMRPEGRIEYNSVVPMVLFTDLEKPDFERLKKEGEAYYQLLFDEFLGY